MPGYCTSRFIDRGKELDHLICSICLGVFRNPVVTQCCRQTYCEECIEKWMSQCKTCPIDRKSLTKEELKPMPRVLINFIDDLKIKCDYESDGCKQVVRIGDLANHLTVCNFSPNQFCKTCKPAICEKKKSDVINSQLLNKSSSIVRIENDQETMQEDLALQENLPSYLWNVTLFIIFLIIMSLFIWLNLCQFHYIKQNNETTDSLGGVLAPPKGHHESPIQSVKLQQNDTIDSIRRELAQSIRNHQNSIKKLKSDHESIEEKLNLARNGRKNNENENESPIDLSILLPIAVLIVLAGFHFASKFDPAL